ncbi:MULTISPECIES: cation:proton antiporter [Legionella]|uniref:Putative monovalent cation:proton antiporter (CPA2 family) n=1 Tax=Legionella donaldsonii TaxID=45060 RepID=A0A378J589_9GAMM|nr:MULTISPECIES: cation:proton antiporter [Legionella]MCC5015284.1 cation:proton antiporter [Legionella sp. 31fI33]STX42087.1 putative monovalent cation:proton antiporter (CPA2 family) [Legionella donaldsonii]
MLDSHIPLITILVSGFGLAFLFGYVAYRLRISPIVGYLLAGVAIGPSTPGYTANYALASELAEIGVILLMFGVGLHFSVKDLQSVKKIAIPGAIVQMVIATLLGTAFSCLLGWPLVAGFVFGLALSVASTVVLLRALEEWNLLKTIYGRIAVGWLIVEDLAVVIILVFIPPMAALSSYETGASPSSYFNHEIAMAFLITLLKAASFIVLMLIFGQRYIPRLLHGVARKGSNELFRLAVLSVALVVAFAAAKLFGVSFALGAFFAGMFLGESTLSHRAAQETLPLRDAFAVLFFVSVGMLLRPDILVEHPFLVLITALIIILGKSIAAFVIVILFRYPFYTALTISVSLAQIGEFSFILAELGYKLGILSQQAKDLILVGAFISIVVNPFLFKMVNPFIPRKMDRQS